MTLGALGFGIIALCSGFQILDAVDQHDPVTSTQFVLFFGSAVLALLFGLVVKVFGDDD